MALLKNDFTSVSVAKILSKLIVRKSFHRNLHEKLNPYQNVLKDSTCNLNTLSPSSSVLRGATFCSIFNWLIM